jgi:hypothetical protein
MLVSGSGKRHGAASLKNSSDKIINMKIRIERQKKTKMKLWGEKTEQTEKTLTSSAQELICLNTHKG